MADLVTLRLATETTRAVRGLQQVTRELNTTVKSLGKLGKTQDKVKKQTLSAGQALEQLGRRVFSFQNVLAGAGVFALVKFTQGLASATAEMTRIEAKLTAATGSTAAAAKEYAFLSKTAQRLGIDLKSGAGDFARMAAAAKNTRLEGEGVRKLFKAVATTGRALALRNDEMAGTFRALEQIISKNKVQSEELRRQLGDRLPGAFRIMADALNVSTFELERMLKSGELMAEDVLPKFAEELERRFGPAAVKAARSALAEFAKLNTTIFETKASFGKEFEAEVAGSFRAANKAASLLAGNVEEIADAVRVLGVAATTGGLFAMVGILKSSWKWAKATSIALDASAAKSIAAAGRLGAIGIAAAGVTLVVGGLVNAIRKNIQADTDLILRNEDLGESFRDLQKDMEDGIISQSTFDHTMDRLIEIDNRIISIAEELKKLKSEKGLFALVGGSVVGRDVIIKSLEDEKRALEANAKLEQARLKDIEKNFEIEKDRTKELAKQREEMEAQLEVLDRQLRSLGGRRETSPLIGGLSTIEEDRAARRESDAKEFFDRMMNPEPIEKAEEAIEGYTDAMEAATEIALDLNVANLSVEDTLKKEEKERKEVIKGLRQEAARLGELANVLGGFAGIAAHFLGSDSSVVSGLNIASGIFSSASANREAGGTFTRTAEGQQAAGALSGANTGAQIGAQFGGQQEVTAFGGLSAGNFAEEGGAVGGAIGGAFFGPAGELVGGVFGAALGSFIKKGADDGAAVIAANGELRGVVTEAEGTLGEAMAKIVKGTVDGLDKALSTIAANGFVLPDIDVKVRGNLARVIVDGLEHLATNTEEAINIAIIQGIKQAKFEGISPEAQQAITASNAVDLGGLLEDINFGKFVGDLGIPEFQLAMRDLSREFDAANQKAVELGISTEKLFKERFRLLQDERDRLLGIERDAQEQRLEDIRIFNDQILEEERKIADSIAQILRDFPILAGEIGQLATDAGFTAGQIGELGDSLSETLGKLPGLVSGLPLFGGSVGIDSNSPAFLQDAANQLRDLLSAQDLLPSIITDQEANRNRGNRAQRREERRRERERLRGEVGSGLSGLRDEASFFGPAEESTRALIDKVEELREKMDQLGDDTSELSVLLETITEQQFGTFIEQMRDIADPMSDLLQPLDDLREQYEDQRRAAELLGRNTDDLTQSFAAAFHEISRQIGQDVLGGAQNMLLDLLRFTGRQEEAARLEFDLSLQRNKLELANLQLAAERLRMEDIFISGLDDTISQISELIGEIEETGFIWNEVNQDSQETAGAISSAIGSIGSSGGGVGTNDLLDFVRQLASMQAEIAGASESLSGVASINKELDTFFASFKAIFSTSNQTERSEFINALEEAGVISPGELGSTGGGGIGITNFVQDLVEQIRSLRISELLEELLKPILEFGKQAAIGANSPLNAVDKFEEERRQFEELLARARGGDEDAIRQIAQAGNALLGSGGGFFGSATAGFAELFNFVTGSIQSLGEDLPGIFGVDQAAAAAAQNHADLMTIIELLEDLKTETQQQTTNLMFTNRQRAGSKAA